MYKRIAIIFQTVIIFLLPINARTAAVWWGTDDMYVTARHYIETESELGAEMILPESPLETVGADVLYIVAHGWTDGNSGGISLFGDNGTEYRLPFPVLLNNAAKNGIRSIVIDSCYSGLAVDAARERKIRICVMAGCTGDELMPVSADGSLFSLSWMPGTVPENKYSVKGHTIHPQTYRLP